ncbi:MAG: hypothetical protein P1U78_04365 [Alcanivoracaceae bacterium]|nr:hypothetical protein [Alcanivoracaceae bacterium]
MHKIIFRGQIQAGQDSATVRENLGKLFRIEDADRLDGLFSGNPVTIKKSLDEAAARKYLAALEKAGARVEVDPPLPDLTGEGVPDFTDFPEMPAEQDLSFATVMQSFSGDPEQPVEQPQPDSVSPEVAQATQQPGRRSWWPLAAGAAAALLVAAVFIFWPADTSAPMSVQEQENLEALFAIAGEGSDEEFSLALTGVSDPDIRKAMHELRAMVASVQDIPMDQPAPEFDMEALRNIAENSSQAEFDAAVQAEADVDARLILLELRAAHEGGSGE